MREVSANLLFCRVAGRDGWTETTFLDGSIYGAHAHETKEYRALASNLGYGDDIHAYCFDHEFAHSFLAQELRGSPSPVLWALAHGRKHPELTVYEEALVIMFQGFLRGVAPMYAVAPDIGWWPIRERAYALIPNWFQRS